MILKYVIQRQDKKTLLFSFNFRKSSFMQIIKQSLANKKKIKKKVGILFRFFTMSMRKIAAVIGSSGIGKSKLAVELCKALHGQAINADALQVKYTEKYNNGTIFLIV